MVNAPYFLAIRTSRLSLSIFAAAVALCLCSAYLSATPSFSRQLDTLLASRIATSLRALTAQIDYRSQLITATELNAAADAAHPVAISNRQGLLIEHWLVARSLLSIEYPETSRARIDAQVKRIDKVYRQILQRISGSLDWHFLMTGMIEEDKQDQELKDRLRRAMRIVQDTTTEVGIFNGVGGDLREGERLARQFALLGLTALAYAELKEGGS